MRVKAQNGNVFEFNLNHIGHGAWVIETLSVNGEPQGRNNYSDPYPNERSARQSTKEFAEKAVKDARWGWVYPTLAG